MDIHLRILVAIVGAPCPDVIYLGAALVALPPLFHLGVMSRPPGWHWCKFLPDVTCETCWWIGHQAVSCQL
jgi:hypothetical protein